MDRATRWGALIVTGASVSLACSASPAPSAGAGGSGQSQSSSGPGYPSTTGPGFPAGGGSIDPGPQTSSSSGQAPIDECAEGRDTCAPDALCTDLPNGYDCRCKPGYTGDGLTCTDLDECAEGIARCDAVATCENTPGAFACVCPPELIDVNGDGTFCVTDDPPGDTCGHPFLVDPARSDVLTGDTTAAAPDYAALPGECPGLPGGAGAASGDQVYRFTPTVTAEYTVRLTTTLFDASLYVVTSCDAIATSCVSAANEACSDCAESVVATLTAGTTYYVIVDGASDVSNDAGAYTLEIIAPVSFDRPVQFDMTDELLHDTILNVGPGGLDASQTAIDGSNFMLVTQSAASRFSPSGIGLPDDAFFPSNAVHPNVQLHWSNADDGPNSRFVRRGESFTFDVPRHNYSHVQVFALSTEGQSSVSFTLTYDGGTSDVRTVVFRDWYDDPAPAGQFFLIDRMDRFGSGALEAAHDPAVTGVDLAPDATKTLVSITVAQPATDFFVFFGAVGY